MSHRTVLAIALPITLSNASTPLVGYVDTLVIGRLGEVALIGGVGIAANVFSFLYWTLAFLRMGTTGFTAQADGAGDAHEALLTLARALLIALAGGLAMILLQVPIARLAFWLMGPSPAVASAAGAYFDIRIWSAPAALANFALIGWLIGLGRAVTAFWLQLLLNAVNLVLAVGLVVGLGLGVAGVGIAVAVAEMVAASAGLAVAAAIHRRSGATLSLAGALDLGPLRVMMAANLDIMIRTLAVLIAFSFFVAQGARLGDTVLAANHVLMGLVMIAIYLLDGFAFAAERLVGQAVGAGDRESLRAAVVATTIWAGVVGLVLTAGFWLAGDALIRLTTSNAAVQAEARAVLGLAALAPIAGVWCFQLDGVFVGATRTADMRNMMLASLAVYFVAWAILFPIHANHGLWLAILVMFVARALLLALRYPARESSVAAGGRWSAGVRQRGDAPPTPRPACP
ncbi:MAG: MATE family efflux transporter [Hyphomicrobiaceae bacterium]